MEDKENQEMEDKENQVTEDTGPSCLCFFPTAVLSPMDINSWILLWLLPS